MYSICKPLLYKWSWVEYGRLIAVLALDSLDDYTTHIFRWHALRITFYLFIPEMFRSIECKRGCETLLLLQNPMCSMWWGSVIAQCELHVKISVQRHHLASGALRKSCHESSLCILKENKSKSQRPLSSKMKHIFESGETSSDCLALPIGSLTWKQSGWIRLAFSRLP